MNPFLCHNFVVKTKRFCHSNLHSVDNLHFNYSLSMAAEILSGRCIIIFLPKGYYTFPG